MVNSSGNFAPLSADQVERFQADGFVVVDDVFVSEDLKGFEESLTLVVQEFISRCEHSTLGQSGDTLSGEALGQGLIRLAEADRSAFDAVYDTAWQMPEFLRLVSVPRIKLIVNQLMRRHAVAPVYGFINRCRITLPGDERSQTGWHREIFQTVPRANFIQIWAPLVFDTSEDMGPIHFCTGSHRANLPKPHWKENANGVSKTTFSQDVADQFEQVPMTLRVGQAAFFPGTMLHGSRPNLSSRVRYAMVGLFHDVEDPNFLPLRWMFSYRGETPREWFETLPEEH